jgi:hypothetical protein
MIPFLLLYRSAIIFWTTTALVPVEIVFDAVEGELERLHPMPLTKRAQISQRECELSDWPIGGR